MTLPDVQLWRELFVWLTSVVDVETDGFMMAWRSLRSVKVTCLLGHVVPDNFIHLSLFSHCL